VTSQEYSDIVAEQLPKLPKENILGEPSRKNTAPCIAYISFKLQQMDPKASLIVAPADHLILDKTAFTKVCLEALDFVNKHSAFITLGSNRPIRIPAMDISNMNSIRYRTTSIR
jgi:mannose-1-phosphate guanylyltransferase